MNLQQDHFQKKRKRSKTLAHGGWVLFVSWCMDPSLSLSLPAFFLFPLVEKWEGGGVRRVVGGRYGGGRPTPVSKNRQKEKGHQQSGVDKTGKRKKSKKKEMDIFIMEHVRFFGVPCSCPLSISADILAYEY